MPTYLNYLVLNCNQNLKNFLISKIREENQNNPQFDKSDIEMTKFLSKNLDKVFTKYTNCGVETLNKLQMIQFYYLQPPQAKLLSDYRPIFENSNQFELVVKNENKIINEETVHNIGSNLNRYKNPFESRLNQACDIIPGKNVKCEFVKS